MEHVIHAVVSITNKVRGCGDIIAPASLLIGAQSLLGKSTLTAAADPQVDTAACAAGYILIG